jgi:hypothetical protein
VVFMTGVDGREGTEQHLALGSELTVIRVGGNLESISPVAKHQRLK